MATLTPASSPDMTITVKVVFPNKDENRRFKLPLNELGANSLPEKLRSLLNIPSSQKTVFERYSDSSSSYITLDSNVPSVYKQLYRAAKAKQKLKIRVTATDKEASQSVGLPKLGSALPERLSTRSYVHPYVSDPAKDDLHNFVAKRLDILEQAQNASSVTLVNPSVPSPEDKREVSASSMGPPNSAYYWPMSQDSGFSEATKSVFEKKIGDAKHKIGNKEINDEAPVPKFFTDREGFLTQHAHIKEKIQSFRRAPSKCASPPGTNFTISCNSCVKAIPDVHWHCGICEMGDFDLCGECVEKGILCPNEDHWLIKRSVKGGKVIPSTTETIAPKKVAGLEKEEKVPGAFTSDLKREEGRESADLSRTCNSCVGVFHETNFVTCLTCEDYDLCIKCHVGLKHGHHPSHSFAPASSDTQLTSLAQRLCVPGRHVKHNAICDGCDKYIYGVRHKCLTCPDWDYCSSCIKDAQATHQGHQFVPVYEQLREIVAKGRTSTFPARHSGIFCDGPLCRGKKSYIQGDRFKCAVCHDTDFCANCEALPKSQHNRTHPLIKFKTPVRNVSVTTIGDKPNGEQMRTMGDQSPQTSSKSTETIPAAPSANAATQVQTVAEVKPSELGKETSKVEEPKVKAVEPVTSGELEALFVRDCVADGSVMSPSTRFNQAWVLRNPGPHAWPVGCSVCYVGGDSMLDVDPVHPSHVKQMYKATTSNITDRVIEAGEEVEFSVVMRTPERKGKAISYWRLKDAAGLPFGHKLWCDIEVVVTCEADGQKESNIEDTCLQAKVEDQIKGEEEQSESKMIFPKLDKESPLSSTHEAQITRAAAAPVGPEEKELLEDVESLELDDDTDSEDVFLTDEEYELIASDDEMMTAKNGKK